MQHVYVATAPRKKVEVITLDSRGNWIRAVGNGEPTPDREGLKDCPYCNEGRRGEVMCKAEQGVYTIAHAFSDVSSIESMALMEIRTAGQIIMRAEPAQRGLTCLFISALAFSGCPKFASVSWSWDHYLANFNDKDLFYAFFSAFLTAEFLRRRDADNGTLKREFMRELAELDEMLGIFVGNIRQLSTRDANLNAFISIIDLASLFSQRTDKYLEHLRRELEDSSAPGAARPC